MSTVILPNEKPKAVKNLGWLLRNWREVEWLGFNYAPNNKRMIDGELVARLKNGGVYITEYASLSVCWNWTDRPVFRGLTFKLRRINDPFDAGRDFTIGDDNWRKINRLEYSKFICFVNSDCTQLPSNDFYNH